MHRLIVGVLAIAVAVFAHHCTKEDCPDVNAVVKGPIPDEFLDKPRYILACASLEVPKDYGTKACAHELISKNEKLDGYNIQFSFKNLTSGDFFNLTFYTKINPNNPDEYVKVDESGNLVHHSEHRVIYHNNNFAVVYGCPEVENNRCNYFWYLCGPSKDISETQYQDVLKAVSGLGLSTEKVRRVDHSGEVCNRPA